MCTLSQCRHALLDACHSPMWADPTFTFPVAHILICLWQEPEQGMDLAKKNNSAEMSLLSQWGCDPAHLYCD